MGYQLRGTFKGVYGVVQGHIIGLYRDFMGLMGFPKLRVPMIRIIVFGVPFWESPE